MTPADRERWRIHREHCASRGTDYPCWGPNACRLCVETGNAAPTTTKPTEGKP